MPKRSKKSRRKGGEGGNQQKSKSGSRSARSRRRREINLESWIEKHIDEFVSATGLDLLGLRHEHYVELLKDIITQLYGSTSSYTKVDVLVRRFRRYSDRIYPVIAARLASLLDKLSEEQLEFVVMNIGDEVLNLASKLYKLAKEYGRDDLISILRSKWSNAWLKRRLQVLPARCPVCGFDALMPDLVCLVCNSVVTDKMLKNYIKFTDQLKELISILSCDEIREILRRGYVLLNGLGLKAPNEERTPVDIEVYLTSNELKLVKSFYKERCEGII